MIVAVMITDEGGDGCRRLVAGERVQSRVMMVGKSVGECIQTRGECGGSERQRSRVRVRNDKRRRGTGCACLQRRE